MTPSDDLIQLTAFSVDPNAHVNLWVELQAKGAPEPKVLSSEPLGQDAVSSRTFPAQKTGQGPWGLDGQEGFQMGVVEVSREKKTWGKRTGGNGEF